MAADTHDLPLELETAQARDLLAAASGKPLLVDCRTPEEHATARIAGAVLIPMQDLPSRLGEIETWRDGRIIVHCHHGIRSLRVARWLRDQGFAHAQSMAGGIDAWSETVDPTVPRY